MIASKQEAAVGNDDCGTSADENEDVVPQCAICWQQDDPTNEWRRLVVLPCCGGETTDVQDQDSLSKQPKELSFSTRFCAGCIKNLALKDPGERSSREYYTSSQDQKEFPQVKFYHPQSSIMECIESQRSSGTFSKCIECPRCKGLIAIDCIGTNENVSYSLTASEEAIFPQPLTRYQNMMRARPKGEINFAQRLHRRHKLLLNVCQSIEVHKPSFLARVMYAGQKREIAYDLWSLAYFPLDNCLIREFSGMKKFESVNNLLRWGILEKVVLDAKNGSSSFDYQLKKEDQNLLLKIFDSSNSDAKQKEKEYTMFKELLRPKLSSLTRGYAKKGYLIRAVKTLQHLGTLHLHFHGLLPPLPLSQEQEEQLKWLHFFCIATVTFLAYAFWKINQLQRVFRQEFDFEDVQLFLFGAGIVLSKGEIGPYPLFGSFFISYCLLRLGEIVLSFFAPEKIHIEFWIVDCYLHNLISCILCVIPVMTTCINCELDEMQKKEEKYRRQHIQREQRRLIDRLEAERHELELLLREQTVQLSALTIQRAFRHMKK